MRKLLGLLVIMALVLALVPGVNGQTDPYVIFDDDIEGSITNTWGWDINNDTINQVVGVDCLNVTIPATSQYENLEQAFGEEVNATQEGYGWLIVWIYGNNSGESWQARLMTDANNFYYFAFLDNVAGWDYKAFQFPGVFSTYGSPDPGNLTSFMFMQNSNNANPIYCKLDYCILSVGLNPTPTPEPIPTPGPTEEPSESNSVHIIYYGLVIGWLLVSFIVSLKYWPFFGPLGAIVGAVLMIVLLTNVYFVVGQYYSETLDQVVNSYMEIGFLYWVPILLIFANAVTPFLKK